MADPELEARVLKMLEEEGTMFSDLLKRLPGVTPLSVKLSLDKLEKEGKVAKFVKDGRYLFGLSRERG